jgi:hypothetical protein
VVSCVFSVVVLVLGRSAQIHAFPPAVNLVPERVNGLSVGGTDAMDG